MKKIIAILLVAVMALSMAACGGASGDVTYAIVCKDASNPYMLRMISGFEDACSKLGVKSVTKSPETATVDGQIQIVNELKGLGFDEVVFTDFCFPATDQISFSGDRAAAINQAAADLATICTSGSFCVSFISNDPLFVLPEHRCRQYRSGVAAIDVGSEAAASGVPDPTINLVFLTETNDTRYDDYSVMRPLDNAHFE